MRKQTITFTICLTLFAFLAGCAGSPGEQPITLSGAFALYPLAVRWQEEYAKLKPDVKLQVAAGGAGKGMTDVLGGLVDIAMVSRNVNQAELDKGALPLAVAKDAVIPTINSANPAVAALRQRGLTKQECSAFWITGKMKNWNEVKGLGVAGAINIYTRSDACGAGEVWSKFLGGKSQDDLAGVQVYGDPGMAEAVAKDSNGIGYNNIGFAYDAKTLKPVAGLEILKIDFNGNGRIDAAEDVYATRNDLTKAIRDGRFPSPPARELFFVVKGQPARANVKAFLVWVLTDGQRFLEESGYINVDEAELKQCLALLR
jgi:phosphate transport system substrate-binding protein